MWDDVAPMCKAHLRERGDALREAFNAWGAKVDGLYIEMRQAHGSSLGARTATGETASSTRSPGILRKQPRRVTLTIEQVRRGCGVLPES